MTGKVSQALAVITLTFAVGLALGFTHCGRRSARPDAAGVSAPTEAQAAPTNTAAATPPPITASNPEAKTYAEEIGGLIDRIEVRPPVVSGNLVIFPVVYKDRPPAGDWLTMQEALKSGALVIKEAGEGNVPTLTAIVKTDRPLFLMAGEVIVGAKQDRVLAHDIIIEPGSRELALPVYCVEPGRWTAVSNSFSDAGFAANQSVRSTVVQKGSQGKVWHNVGEVNARSGKSASGSLRQSYDDEQLKKEREAYLAAVRSVPGEGVVGAVVAINGKFQNADLFATPALFTALWPKLSETYAQDAVQARTTQSASATPELSVSDARGYLVSVLDADYKEFNNPGAGAEFELKGKDKAGSVILREKSLVHLAVFPGEQRPGSGSAPRSIEARGDANAPAPAAGGTASVPAAGQVEQRQFQQLLYYGGNQVTDGSDRRPDVYKDKGMEFQIKKSAE